jgi:cellulose synthase/poly-beta-1,6-N-acetylglucosamine synthase-like glycosyltransferase
MTAVALAAALAALAIALRAALPRATAPRLEPPATGAEPPAVDVLLPVRDEEANLAGCLAALLAQSVPVAVRVLDDGSRDRTAAIAAALAAGDPRVAFERVPEPPAGTSGKVAALAHGARRARGEWLLAIDADARPAPAALARALATAGARRLDALSLAARQRAPRPGEALLTPLVFALLDLALGDWRRAADGEGEPVANGQFVLVRRSALAAIGGYDALATEPLDDVALARRLAAGGFRVGFLRAGAALSVRMYRGVRATFHGWRRNLALVFGARPARPLAWSALLAAPGLVALAALAAERPRTALAAWSAGALASAVARAGTGSSPLWGVLHPLDSLALFGTLALAARDHRRGRLARWRGRELAPGSDRSSRPA